MAKIGFDSKFKRASFFDFPKIKLEKNEKARIRIVDAPTAEFVHNFRKIVIEDGQVKMKLDTFTGTDGVSRTREVPDTTFLGKYICLGDDDILDKDGVDPKNCPACKAALENANAVDKPKRRIVCHVLKYAVKQGTFTVSAPFQAEVLAWEMPDSRFSKLIDIAEEHGDLSKLDLCLGPCENKSFQKFEIQPGAESALSDSDNLARAKEIIKSNMSEDLTPLLGRKASALELQAKVKESVDQYNRGFGAPVVETAPQAQGITADAKAQGLGLDFSSLVADEAPAEKASEPVDTPQVKEAAVEAPALSTLATPAEEEPAKKTSKTDEIPSLDDILGGLG